MPIRKLLFICSGLEPGHDGIGDYCRSLGHELAGLGVQCAIVALHDRLVARETVAQEARSIMQIRIPSAMPLADRIGRAASFLAEWRPDWVSLQFVAYGFQDRGLPFRETGSLSRLLRGYRVHLLLHELWLGLIEPSSVKEGAVGALQRYLVRRLVRRLQPLVIHTSNAYSQNALARAGVNAGVLPLFGNIPIDAEVDHLWLAKALSSGGGADFNADLRPRWTFGTFGSIPAHWVVEHLFVRLCEMARKAGRRVAVISIGQTGSAGPALFARWQEQFPEIEFRSLGPRSPSDISQFLHAIDFGLTPYPEVLLGKSGAAMAMLEHGAPVIVGWGEPSFPDPALEAEFGGLIWRNDSGLEARLNHPPPRRIRDGRSAMIARSLLNCFEQHE